MKFTKLGRSAVLLMAAGALSAGAAQLPNTPVPFKSGAGAMLNNVIYIGLGSAGSSWYKLDLNAAKPAWEPIAAFPVPARDQAQAAALDGRIYVFGGCGKAAEDASRISVQNDVYVYDPTSDAWSKVMTRAPYGLTGHTVLSTDGSSALIIGSVNKAIFDGYFEDIESAQGDEALTARINADYTGKRVQDYFFSKFVLRYDPQRNAWTSEGVLPGFGTAGAAAAVTPAGEVYVMGGEKKPGLRTAQTLRFTLHDYGAAFTPAPDLIPAEGETVQEGVAGAFAGVSHGLVLLAGGANFPGATENYAKGQNFAHQGCTKTWRSEIYAFDGSSWEQKGDLPLPLGYGVTVQHGEELILIGGETTDGAATSQVLTLSVENGEIQIN